MTNSVILEVQEGAPLLGGTRMEDYQREAWGWDVAMMENERNMGIISNRVVDGPKLEVTGS